MANRLTEAEAVDRIRRNGGKVGDHSLEVDGCGLKVLAAVDCLVHYHGYAALVNNHRQFPMDWQLKALREAERKERLVRKLLVV